MTITAGYKSRFAIESGMTKVYARLGFRALGYFVIFIRGKRYGVLAPDATMLACSFGTVEDRIAARGEHTAPFRDAIYAPDQEDQFFFGLTHGTFRDLVYSNRFVWAPDDDEAFDDSSYVLQFDVEDRVRLIAFKLAEEGYHHDPRSLEDIWLGADEFYSILQQWRDAFEKAWTAAPKIAEQDDGAEGGPT